MQQIKKGQSASPVSAAFEAEEMVSPDASKTLDMIDEALTSGLGNILRNRTSEIREESIRAAHRVSFGSGPSIFSEMMTSCYGDYLKHGGHLRCLYCGAREGTAAWSYDCPNYAVMVPDDEEDW